MEANNTKGKVDFVKHVIGAAKNILTSDDIVPKLYHTVVWREDNCDTVVAMNPLTGVVNFMNPTLAYIFKLCDGSNSKRDIIEDLNNRCFGVEKSTLEADIQDALLDLFLNNYIELIDTRTSEKHDVVDLIANINNENYCR